MMMVCALYDNHFWHKSTNIGTLNTARLLPTDDLNTGNFTISQSPFTIVFTEGKLGEVANVMNSIILITVCASCTILKQSAKSSNRSFHVLIVVCMLQAVCY